MTHNGDHRTQTPHRIGQRPHTAVVESCHPMLPMARSRRSYHPPGQRRAHARLRLSLPSQPMLHPRQTRSSGTVHRQAGRWHNSSVTPEDVAKTLVDQALALQREVSCVGALFEQTNFLGDTDNMPHAHYGYLMAILGQIDTLSLCCGNGGGKRRLKKFLDDYIHPGKDDVHPVVVKMLRHALMHTGTLRYIYDEKSQTVYTWRVYFGELPAGPGHYTVTSEDLRYQDHVINLIGLAKLRAPKSVRAFNLSLTNLADDLVWGAQHATADMLATRQKRGNAVSQVPDNLRTKTD